MLIKSKILKNKDFTCFRCLDVIFIMFINIKMPTIASILTNEHDKFHAQLS